MSLNNREGSRQLLAELESLLTQPTEPTRTEVEAAHGAATQAIRSVNERLASVHQLIAAGRRAEGIEIAEGPPHVLDEIAILDSQLIRDWEHWSGQFGLPRFAPLRSDLASLLNGAYTAENQLEHLLRRHRLLAIGRANLRQRIAVLSQLSAADPSNPQWNKGLALCQRQRLEQLSERSTLARKLRDLRGLQQIMAELRQTRWLTPVSKAQVEAVQKQINLLQIRESTNEAIALSEHIQDAYAAGDKSRLGPLIVRWREIESKIDPHAMSDVLPQVRSVVDWFEQELQAQRDAEAQSRALQRVASIQSGAQADEIRSVMEGIVSTGAEVPVELRESYVDRVREETRSKRLRAGLITGAIAAALLGITTIVAIAYRSYQNEAALASMVDAIDAQLASGDLDGAEGLLETAPRDDERFHDFRDQLSQKQLAEKVRADQFKADGEKLRIALDEAKSVEEFNSLAIRVSQLADRAEQDGEFVAAKELTEYVDARREQRKNEAIQGANQLVVEVREGLKTLVPDSGAKSTLTDWIQKIQKARTDAWIREESQLLLKLDETSNQVADRRESIREKAAIEKSLEKITRSVGDWDRLGIAWHFGQSTAMQSSEASFRRLRIAHAKNENCGQRSESGTKSHRPGRSTRSCRQANSRRDRSALTWTKSSGLGWVTCRRPEILLPPARLPCRLQHATGELWRRSSRICSRRRCRRSMRSRSRPPNHHLLQWYYFPPSDDSFSPRGDGFRLKYYTDLEMIDLETGTYTFSSVKVPAGFVENKDGVP